MERLQPLLRPRSIAIVGASPNPGRATGAYNNLRKLDFAGPIYPVNPKYPEIWGLPCCPSVADLPEAADCAIISLPASVVPGVLRQCAQRGVRAAVVLGSGFGEAGPEGKRLQAEVVSICQEAGILLCGPNCHGVINLVDGVAVSAGTMPEQTSSGGLALVMQSGVILGNLIDVLSQRGITFSYLVSSGNEAVVNSAQYLADVVETPETRVVAMFMEGIRDPEGLKYGLRRAAELGKPVLVLKTGRSERGQQAALAHTGSLTGSDAVIDAVLREYGAVRVGDLDELVETAALFMSGQELGPGLGVLTISGAGCGLVSDLADEVGVVLADMDARTLTRLQEVLPDFATPSNPLDVTGAVGERPGLFAACMEAWQQDPNVGTIAVALRAGRQAVGQRSGRRGGYYEMAEVASQAVQSGGKPVICFTLTGPAYDQEMVSILLEGRVPFLFGSKAMLKAVRHGLAYRTFREVRKRIPAEQRDGRVQWSDTALHLLRQGVSGKALTERSSKAVLAAYGLPVTQEGLAVSAHEAALLAQRMGFPVVIKVESADIPHKTEAGGIRIGVRSAEEAKSAFMEVVSNARRYKPDAEIAGVLVQEQVPAGVEMIVGARVDSQFGPVVVVGLGGIYVEILRDTALMPAPVSDDQARAMIAQLKGLPLLSGARGRPRADVGALAQVVSRLSWLASDLQGQIAEIDLNPVIVLPEGQGARVVDALVVPRTESGGS